MIDLTLIDLSLAASLVLLLAWLSSKISKDLSRQVLIAALRTTVQLFLLGLVLKVIFSTTNLLWITLMSMVMLLVAGREVMVRQGRRFSGFWSFGVGTASMFVSSFAVTLFALVLIIGNHPWYEPQYAIPLLGMLLGNTMNGVAIAMDRLTQMAWQRRGEIEARLMLGDSEREAIADICKESIRSGLIPILNAMTVAGVVSLPGMMTGQILAGAAPEDAVRYQILIMFLIASGTGMGTMTAVWFSSRRLFDERQRLRLDRLK
ncbi:MAG: iron export ABC transporter permease subunit FetB [Gammaproteobacteria bacterium]|nr:iron export ABC transporter permease subunit FetB [Gammaproteobacteria bacterium]